MLSNYIPIGNYIQCTRCGSWHDDGTWDLCLDCIDKEAEERRIKNNENIEKNQICFEDNRLP